MQQSLPEHADLAACRTMMRGGSKSFFAAGLLLPKHVYRPASALYAFCRLADDAIDEAADHASGKAAALSRLRVRLDLAYAGTPVSHPADPPSPMRSPSTTFRAPCPNPCWKDLPGTRKTGYPPSR